MTVLQPRSVPKHRRFGLLRVRSPLLAQSLGYFLFLRVLRCFSSPGLLSPLRRVTRSPVTGCPIRKSTDQGIFAPPRGLSQLITSFIASESQGILHVPLSPFFMTFLSGINRCHILFSFSTASYESVARALVNRFFSDCYSLCLICFSLSYLFNNSDSLPVCQCPLLMVVPGRVELPTSTLSV